MTPTDSPRQPWWRVPMMWLVLAGPAAVVVAGVATAVVAVRGADQPLATTVPQAHASVPTGGAVPAVVGRNHAAGR